MRIRDVGLGVACAFLLLSGCGGGGGGGPTQPGTTTGSLRGSVADQTGAPVAGVAVTLTAAAQAARTTNTASDGNYSFTNLAIGAYTVQVAAPAGFTVNGSGSTAVVVVAGQQANAATIVLNKTVAGPPPSLATVSLQYTAFTPASVTIARNGTVRWTNNDGVIHNVTGGGVTIGELAPNQQRTQSFATAGTFNYQCTIHAGMNGTVVVQ